MSVNSKAAWRVTIAIKIPDVSTSSAHTRASVFPGTREWTDSTVPSWTSVRPVVIYAPNTRPVSTRLVVTIVSARTDTLETATLANVSLSAYLSL